MELLENLDELNIVIDGVKAVGSAKFNYLEVTIYIEGKDETDIEQRSSKTLKIHNVLRKRIRKASTDMYLK